ncbi:unnamed protein product [Bursaphelenchus okinawaensis]|uniref:7-dehydrocholesterol reductase n=1 Tax=Bursaphelenchus okinawaensis TaxID=465554 RepID=A0A811LAI5_9BILA|nr:unnamed protein product [Bursaphelenchus okinawaensis]CAG9122057.1 unnamed protein product [Bursaphelenchus okinawaensis]
MYEVVWRLKCAKQSKMAVTMRPNIVRRRSSSNLANSNLSTTNRRSSISQKDIDYIQSVLSRKKQVSNQLTLIFMVLFPIFIHLYYPFVSTYHGRITKLHKFKLHDFLPPLKQITPYLIVSATVLLQFLFFWLLPATVKIYRTQANQLFRQHCNAFSGMVLNALVFGLGAAFRWYSPTLIFDNWNGIMVVMGMLSMVVILWQFYAHSEKDDEPEDVINDIFFGKLAQPVVFDMDLKAFLTNRVLGALYCCYLFSALAKQRITVGVLTPGLICCASLQLIYWLRRSWNDPCRPSSLDNQTNKAGFCRIWGALVFLPTLYLTPVTLMAQTSKSPHIASCCALFLLGLLFQLWTGLVDEQKKEFRDCDGQMKIDGKDPFYIVAKYRKEGGEAATNILLGSGYWGKARHFNYATEILSFTCWTLVVRWDFMVGYIPVLFLVGFLWLRANRDEFRCLLKYQHHWMQYTNKVRYQFFPSIY